MKPITKVFLIIGVLVICLLVWALLFNDGALLENLWNTVAHTINDVAGSLFGTTTDIVPDWDTFNGGNNVTEGQGNAEF